MKRIQYLDPQELRCTTLHYFCQWILHESYNVMGWKEIWQRFRVIWSTKKTGGQCLILFWCISSASPITFLLSIYLSSSFLSSLFVTDPTHSSFFDLPFPSVILSAHSLLHSITSLPLLSSPPPLVSPSFSLKSSDQVFSFKCLSIPLRHLASGDFFTIYHHTFSRNTTS